MDLSLVANQKPDYISKSGSSYYFAENGVYRLSNHWGRAANCKWRLQTQKTTNLSRTKLGFAFWNAFYSDNDTEKLYFITVDFEIQSVHYQHKDSINYQEQFQLRTATETTKIIKEIRHLLANDGWAKHFDQPIEVIRKAVVEQLITTNASLINIKRELRNTL
jgi:hypothetical protein